MKKKPKSFAARVFFNASVLLSAMRSPKGASGELLRLIGKRRFTGIISETVFDEAMRHPHKIPMDPEVLKQRISQHFPIVQKAPEDTNVKQWQKKMLDVGDAHLFASCQEIKATHLVSLDKHHVLIFKGKIPNLLILSPAELLEELKQKKNR